MVKIATFQSTGDDLAAAISDAEARANEFIALPPEFTIISVQAQTLLLPQREEPGGFPVDPGVRGTFIHIITLTYDMPDELNSA